jgi:uncharacterized membrane protein YoaK (UPF0700 family)
MVTQEKVLAESATIYQKALNTWEGEAATNKVLALGAAMLVVGVALAADLRRAAMRSPGERKAAR